MLKKTTCGLYDGNIIQFIVFNGFIYFIWSVYSGCLLRYFHNIATVWCVFLRFSANGCQPRFVFSRQELFAIRRISPSLLLRKQCLSLRELFQSLWERGWGEGYKQLKNCNLSPSIILLIPSPTLPRAPRKMRPHFAWGPGEGAVWWMTAEQSPQRGRVEM